MRQFEFTGDPAGYQWDFPLTSGATYNGNREAYHRHPIAELYDMAVASKDKDFLNEWEEKSPN